MRILSDNTVDTAKVTSLECKIGEVDSRTNAHISILREDMNRRDRIYIGVIVLLLVIEIVRLFF
jgi:hypothetical protein